MQLNHQIPWKKSTLSPEPVADVTEYAFDKRGFVYAAADVPCALLVAALQMMSGNH